MLGAIGIILAVVLVVWMIFKGWHMTIVAVVSSLVVIVTSRMNVWDAFSVSFANSFKNFAGSWMLMFVLGAIFGKIMQDSRASLTIANAVVKKIGKQNVILAILITTLILSYGGIGVFVIAFTMYPICIAMFKEADLPKEIFPGLLLALPATVGMSVGPGVPSVQNLIPTETFGTTIYAAPIMATICSVFIFAMDFLFYNYVAKRCRAKGMHFQPGTNDLFTEEKNVDVPKTWAAFLPLIVLLGSIFIIQSLFPAWKATFVAVIGMTLAILVALGLFYKRFNINNVIGAGCANGLSALMITSSIMGFGGVVQAAPAFRTTVDWLLALPLSPLLLAFISINVICAITGSSSGGLRIFMETLGQHFLNTGINPAVLHRMTAIASAGLDAMPHASGVVLANSVANTEMVHTYKYTFVSQCLIPLCAFGVAYILYLLGIV